MEDELATEDSKRLARVGSSEEMAADGDVKDEVGWDGTYVAYEGVTYELAYLEAVC